MFSERFKDISALVIEFQRLTILIIFFLLFFNDRNLRRVILSSLLFGFASRMLYVLELVDLTGELDVNFHGLVGLHLEGGGALVD